MLDVKRCIEEFKPEGFEIRNFNGIEIIEFHNILSCPVDMLGNDLVLHPLFLQRVIEGVKIKDKEQLLSIEPNRHGKWYFSLWNQYCSDLTNTPDQAKEQAIKYILSKI